MFLNDKKEAEAAAAKERAKAAERMEQVRKDIEAAAAKERAAAASHIEKILKVTESAATKERAEAAKERKELVQSAIKETATSLNATMKSAIKESVEIAVQTVHFNRYDNRLPAVTLATIPHSAQDHIRDSQLARGRTVTGSALKQVKEKLSFSWSPGDEVLPAPSRWPMKKDGKQCEACKKAWKRRSYNGCNTKGHKNKMQAIIREEMAHNESSSVVVDGFRHERKANLADNYEISAHSVPKSTPAADGLDEGRLVEI